MVISLSLPGTHYTYLAYNELGLLSMFFLKEIPNRGVGIVLELVLGFDRDVLLLCAKVSHPDAYCFIVWVIILHIFPAFVRRHVQPVIHVSAVLLDLAVIIDVAIIKVMIFFLTYRFLVTDGCLITFSSMHFKCCPGILSLSITILCEAHCILRIKWSSDCLVKFIRLEPFGYPGSKSITVSCCPHISFIMVQIMMAIQVSVLKNNQGLHVHLPKS